jgi:hypothetical protein
MILDRWYKPPDDELIYHYCSADAFLQIVTTRSIWAGASYALNDVSERSWGYSIFTKVAKALEQETGREFLENIYSPVVAGYLHSTLMVACFSRDADVLSQWRAYADDGRGFAIGFAPTSMRVPAKPLCVLYEEHAQIVELTNNLKHTYEVEKSMGFKYDDKFKTHLFHIGNDLCAYKHPGFREEQEIRLCHLCGMDQEEKKVIPLGARGEDGERLSEPLKTYFRMSKGILTPYVVLDYSTGGTIAPIKEIILGPRNQNSELNIEIFLTAIGVTEVAVSRSETPYY